MHIEDGRNERLKLSALNPFLRRLRGDDVDEESSTKRSNHLKEVGVVIDDEQ